MSSVISTHCTRTEYVIESIGQGRIVAQKQSSLDILCVIVLIKNNNIKLSFSHNAMNLFTEKDPKFLQMYE